IIDIATEVIEGNTLRDDNHDGDHPETSNPSPPVPSPIQQIPHTISSIKLPILKKGEYDIWAMKMEHYLSHTDYPIWQVIQNGNGHVSVTTDTNRMIKVLPPKIAEEVVAKERERKARTTLLMALPKDHLAKFNKMADAKEMVYIKGTTASSSSNTKNMAFVSADNTSSTNDVSTAYSVSSPSVSKLQKEGSSSYTDDVIHSFFANQSSAPQLDYDDLDQINDDDMEKMDLKWQVAMISMRIRKFHKRTGRNLQFDTKDPVGFDKTKVECFNFHKMGHFARDRRAKGNHNSKRRDVGYNGNKARDSGRRPAYQDDSKALVTIDGEDIDWSRHVEEDAQNYAMMAYSSSNSGSDNEVKSCSKTCEESYARLKKLYDEQRDKLGDASVEITAYTLTLKKILADESNSKPSEYASCESNSHVETTTSIPEPIASAPKVVCEPKVWNDAPIIEEENIKVTDTPNHSPKVEKQDRNGHTRKGLGYDFTRKACFVCGPKEAKNSAGTQDNDDQSANTKEIDLHEEHFILPIWSAYSTTVKSSGDKIEKTTDAKTCEKPVSQVEQIFLEELEKLKRQENKANDAAKSPRKEATHDSQNANTNSTNLVNDVSTPISTDGPSRELNN
nr:hypothetical protein [Tanacetum cinerariifolium]